MVHSILWYLTKNHDEENITISKNRIRYQRTEREQINLQKIRERMTDEEKLLNIILGRAGFNN